MSIPEAGLSSDFPFPRLLSRAWYSDSIAEFCASDSDRVIGELARNSEFAIRDTSIASWDTQIHILRPHLNGLQGHIFFEFVIPRMGRRIDVLLLLNGVLLLLEFKVGETQFSRAALDQVWDYALDMKNFHRTSHSLPIVPILIATEARETGIINLRPAEDDVYYPLNISAREIRDVIDEVVRRINCPEVVVPEWLAGGYYPSPTIVEAACALYSEHSVDAIARHDAGAQNLHLTSGRIESIIDTARRECTKCICFVTGVPGAGKTLVGLDIATKRGDKSEPTHAVYLSGNGALVAVLTEALTRDEVQRAKLNGEKKAKGMVRETVKAFIQNVHHFRDEALRHATPPVDHVVIFDESQRAWNREQTKNFMQRKKKLVGIDQSEPEFLIGYMDRHQDWAVIICLVGGGQEISMGEAGIAEWLRAIQQRYPHWNVYISPELSELEYGATETIQVIKKRTTVFEDEALHLSVSMRSFRAEKLSNFVKALLDIEKDTACKLFAEIAPRYPLVVTRDINKAKQWVRHKARGTERYGVLSTSRAMRLRSYALEVRVLINPVHWFLNARDDVRSSYYLEDVATETQVQGLEVDWAIVGWDADLRMAEGAWRYGDFRGSRWTKVHKPELRRYMVNAYRVLLNRARQGMVIFVPPGDVNDHTRPPEFYDSTFEYLRDLGLQVI